MSEQNLTPGLSQLDAEALEAYTLTLRSVNELLEETGAECGLNDEEVHMTQLGYHCLQLCLKLGSLKTMQLMARVQRDSALNAARLSAQDSQVEVNDAKTDD